MVWEQESGRWVVNGILETHKAEGLRMAALTQEIAKVHAEMKVARRDSLTRRHRELSKPGGGDQERISKGSKEWFDLERDLTEKLRRLHSELTCLQAKRAKSAGRVKEAAGDEVRTRLHDLIELVKVLRPPQCDPATREQVLRELCMIGAALRRQGA